MGLRNRCRTFSWEMLSSGLHFRITAQSKVWLSKYKGQNCRQEEPVSEGAAAIIQANFDGEIQRVRDKDKDSRDMVGGLRRFRVESWQMVGRMDRKGVALQRPRTDLPPSRGSYLLTNLY